MIVVDINLVIYSTVPTPNTALANHVHARDQDWAVPQLWILEYLNYLAGSIRRGELSDMDAAALLVRGRAIVSIQPPQAPEHVLALLRNLAAPPTTLS